MAPLQVASFTSGKLFSNSYVAIDEDSFCIVVDPGENAEELCAYIGKRKVDCILLTHGHYDHIGGVDTVKEKTGAPVAVHHSEAEFLNSPELNLSAESGRPVCCKGPDVLVDDGQEFECGVSVKVIHTPGHSPGSVCYLVDGHHLFSGDTLLAGLIGPTNFPGGDRELLKTSIKEKLFILDKAVKVYPGHGGMTSIGEEKEHNLFPNFKSFF